MTAAPINSAQSSNGVNAQQTREQRPLHEDAIARFRQTLTDQALIDTAPTSAKPTPAKADATNVNADAGEQRHLHEDALARFRQPLTDVVPIPATIESNNNDSTNDGSTNSNSNSAPDPERRESERRDPNAPMLTVAATIGSLHHAFTPAELAPGPTTGGDTAEAARLIEQATSVLLERATRSDACRVIVSLDHAIAGGASAEFVRDGAFLYVRLHARTEASYRSMWTHRAELQERLAASSGLQTRVEILEVHGDGSPA
jgi:hypothetical protein